MSHLISGGRSAHLGNFAYEGGPSLLARCGRSCIMDMHFYLRSRENAFPRTRLVGLEVRRGYGYAFVAYPLNIVEVAGVQPSSATNLDSHPGQFSLACEHAAAYAWPDESVAQVSQG